MFKKLDLFLENIISKLTPIKYRDAQQKIIIISIIKNIIYIAVLMLFLFVIYLSINYYSSNNSSPKFNLKINPNVNNSSITTTPTFYVITPSITYEEYTVNQFINELVINDNQLKYNITIKKNYEIKIINSTTANIGLIGNNGITINIQPGNSQYISFIDPGEYIFKDIIYQDFGFTIKIKVIE